MDQSSRRVRLSLLSSRVPTNTSTRTFLCLSFSPLVFINGRPSEMGSRILACGCDVELLARSGETRQSNNRRPSAQYVSACCRRMVLEFGACLVLIDHRAYRIASPFAARSLSHNSQVESSRVESFRDLSRPLLPSPPSLSAVCTGQFPSSSFSI